MKLPGLPPKQGLYDPQHEKDSCGIGFVVNIKGQNRTTSSAKACKSSKISRTAARKVAIPARGTAPEFFLQVPHEFLRRAAGDAGVSLPGAGEYGVGQVFLPPHAAARQQCETLFGKIVEKEGSRLLGWRDVPVKSDTIGVQARKTEPFMRQVFIARDVLNEAQFERKLYVIRKLVEKAIRESAIEGREHFYIPSLSASTIVYKGLLLPHQMAAYYQDLTDAEHDQRAGARAFALQHQYVSDLAARPSLSSHLPQRRDQHAQGQCELDEGPPGAAPFRVCSARTWKSCFRSSTSSKATRPVSIMRSSFCCWGAGRCPMR